MVDWAYAFNFEPSQCLTTIIVSGFFLKAKPPPQKTDKHVENEKGDNSHKILEAGKQMFKC